MTPPAVACLDPAVAPESKSTRSTRTHGLE